MNNFKTFLHESKTARFFIPAGIFLIIFGVITVIINNNNKDYIQTEATVINVILEEEAYIDADGNQVEATYAINLKYTVDGKEYEGELSGLSKYNVGDKMKIYYNPNNPSQITQTKSMLLSIVIIVLGIISLLSGIVSCIKSVKKNKVMA